MIILLALGTAWLLGAASLAWLWPVGPARGDRGTRLLWVALALGAGLGLASWVHFVGLVVFNGNGAAWIASEFAAGLLAVGSALSAFYFRSKSAIAEPGSAPVQPVSTSSPIRRAMIVASTAAIGFIGGVGAWCQARSYANYPHGDWDAWAIWNARARFLYLSTQPWQSGFSQVLQWSHPDYPLLVPLNVVRLWHYAGACATLGPAMLQLFVWLGVSAMLYAGVSRIRGHFSGLAAVFCLASNNAFWVQGEAQIADLPLAMYMLGTIVVLNECLIARGRERIRLAGLCGLLAGCCAWTKNEGLTFAIIVGAAMAATLIRRRTDWIAMGAWLLGAGPFVVCNLLVKHFSQAGNDLVGGQSFSRASSVMLDPGRHVLILRTIVAKLLEFPEWGISFLGVVVAWFALSGLRNIRANQIGLIPPGACLLAQGVVYYLVYLLTPRDLAWQLGTSIDRLFLHLWPAFLFVAFVGMDPIWGKTETAPTGDQPA